MEHLLPLFDRYDRILIFDTETTGLDFSRDEIIQFSAVVVECPQGKPEVTREYDRLLDYALRHGAENAYIQEGGTAEESFIPPFDLEGV